ncbi:hypothetical protein PCA01_00720 [Pseudoalteromonas carrageenovora]|nr:hypothetical protein PCA01_00720 [Pseudoalteromonas carrageenovora]
MRLRNLLADIYICSFVGKLCMPIVIGIRVNTTRIAPCSYSSKLMALIAEGLTSQARLY